MSRRSPSLPLVLAAAFFLMVAMMVSGILPSPVAVALVQCSGDYAPPNVGYDDCKKTQTAEAGGPTATNTPGSGGGGGGSQPPAPTSTPTSTRTAAPTQVTAPVTATLAPTSTPTSLAQAQQSQPTPTATSELPAGVAAQLCVPGTVVPLAGEAPPNTPLLAYFDTRPVGGGFSRADGLYSIDLLIGDERPGTYVVEVRERESDALVGQFACEVPAFTPTPTTGSLP